MLAVINPDYDYVVAVRIRARIRPDRRVHSDLFDAESTVAQNHRSSDR